MSEPVRLLPKSSVGWIGYGLGLLFLAAWPQIVQLFDLPMYYVDLGTSALIAAMLALSLQVLVGATGLVSLGHGAFYGLAAYSVYLVSPKDTSLSMWITLPIAMIAAGLAALVIGAISLRAKGFFFLMVTLAFGQMIYFVFHDTKIGGGTDGAFLAKPLISAFGQELQLARRQKPLGPYYLALAELTLMFALLAWLMRTMFGRVLEGIRANEHRMQVIGYETYRYKLTAFVIAGVLAGVAGHMWAQHRGVVNPEIVGWHKSAEALLMILLGGLGSLAGPIIGAIAYTGLGEGAQLLMAKGSPLMNGLTKIGLGKVADALADRKLLLEGVVILVVVIFAPRGLGGLFQRGGSGKAGGGHG
jgi:branched-chain amino acid transport system permease protein